MQGCNYEISVCDLCTQAEIPRQTWYDQFGNPTFVAWWTEQYERWFALQLPRVGASMFAMATGKRDKGNTQAAKLLYERFDRGYAPRSRQELSGNDGGPVKTYICVDPKRVTGEATDSSA